MQEHVAIDVSPGPIQTIHLFSDYFPHFYLFAQPALCSPDPRPVVMPTIYSAPQLHPDSEPEGDSDDSSEWGQETKGTLWGQPSQGGDWGISGTSWGGAGQEAWRHG